MTATTTYQTTQLSPEQMVAYADGALGAAGHQVTDPAVRELMAQVARGELTGDQAVAKLSSHIEG